LDGGLGRDVLVGGSGADTFFFTVPAGGKAVDTIADFNRSADQIGLVRSEFAALGASVTAGEFCLGKVAEDGNDRLIYDRVTGRLWYDADGDGRGAKVLFAVIDTKIALSFADFDVI
jgi:Ca2+-binding RTX toxin-like protein